MIETLDASIPASREAYLEGARPTAEKYFGIPLTLVVVSQPPPPSLLRDASSADKKKCTPRKHNGENDPRFLRHCSCALGTTPSRSSSRTVTVGGTNFTPKRANKG